ncbi:calcium/sodium antiporter [Acidimangrovimonas pyrenivorans]|uniref:Calcium/sodium antiporter n=1 Tax=Acidimangrovimonas pyrenivorans TaxID=2030798 RepID=A0ABV7AJT3_9RHOB
MTLDLLFLVGGLIVLVLAGDALVRGAVNLSLRLGIPSLIVGLTVVAFGTSAPELLVSVKAVLDHAPGIALGNVVGSNIANILLVLGLPAMISTIHASNGETRRSFLTMLAATVLFMAVAFAGPIRAPHALILLAGLGLMLWDSYRSARAHRRALAEAAGETEEEAEEEERAELEGADPGMPGWQIAVFLALGLIGLPLGADLLVDGAVGIARILGVSETVIGLTLVAIGTSLPELATCVTAALRRQTDVVMGNVIGSNIFNLLGIIGVAGLVGPLPVPAQMLHFDLWAMLAASLVLAPIVLYQRDITRLWGFALLAAYVLFIAAIVS